MNRITDYFRNRKQFVQINDSKSDAFRQICGVPQGFILGSLFFIIDSTICESGNELEFIFADDTVFFPAERIIPPCNKNNEIKKEVF